MKKKKFTELREMYSSGSPINALYTGTFFDALPELLDEIERLRGCLEHMARQRKQSEWITWVRDDMGEGNWEHTGSFAEYAAWTLAGEVKEKP